MVDEIADPGSKVEMDIDVSPDVCLSKEHEKLVFDHFQHVEDKLKELEKQALDAEIPLNISGRPVDVLGIIDYSKRITCKNMHICIGMDYVY